MALALSLALVVFVSVVGASVRAALQSGFDEAITAELVVESARGEMLGGLEPAPVELENPGDQPEGIVEAVEPSGTLQEGDEVTVSFWAKVPPGQQRDEEGSAQG